MESVTRVGVLHNQLTAGPSHLTTPPGTDILSAALLAQYVPAKKSLQSTTSLIGKSKISLPSYIFQYMYRYLPVHLGAWLYLATALVAQLILGLSDLKATPNHLPFDGTTSAARAHSHRNPIFIV